MLIMLIRFYLPHPLNFRYFPLHDYKYETCMQGYWKHNWQGINLYQRQFCNMVHVKGRSFLLLLYRPEDARFIEITNSSVSLFNGFLSVLTVSKFVIYILFTNQFSDFFLRDGCNYTLDQNKRIKFKKKKDYSIKCLGLNIVESLTSWLMETEYLKSGRNDWSYNSSWFWAKLLK